MAGKATMPDGTGRLGGETEENAGGEAARRQSPSGLMALDPQLMADAGAAASDAQGLDHDDGHGAGTAAWRAADDGGGAPPLSAGGVESSAASAQRLVFIDGSVPDYQILAQGATPGVTVVLLNPNEN